MLLIFAICTLKILISVCFSVTGTNEAVRKRLASEESAVSPAPPGSRSTTSTLKSTKSNQSSKSLKVLKKCFNVHRRFAR